MFGSQPILGNEQNIEKEKKVRCTTRCTTGCKKCTCKVHGEKCSQVCGCINCKNNGVEEDIEFLKNWNFETDLPSKEISAIDGKAKEIPSNIATPLQVFLFMTKEVIVHLIEDTQQKYFISFKEDHIYRFILCILAMGLSPKPEIHLHWSNNTLYENRYIKKILSRDNFYFLLKYIHYQIDKVLEIMNNKFIKHWSPGTYVAVDESLIHFKGRYAYRQHIPNKPAGTGIKLYGIADNSGFLFSVFIYQGPKHGEETKPFQIVKNFSLKLPKDKEYIVFADSYYGSFILAEELHKLKFNYVLCCKSDRPSSLFSKKLHCGLKKNAFNYGVWNKEIIAISYWDNSKCNFISNCFGAGKKEKPEAVISYNKYKGGIDIADSYWARYLVNFRNYKWTQASFFALFKIIIVNSMLIYNNISGENKISQRKYLEEILFSYKLEESMSLFPNKKN